MRIKDVLNESVTDAVARFYIEASDSCDRFYNPEDVKYKNQNHTYYDKFFKQWFSEEVVPVFTTPVTKAQPEYTNIPKEGKLQSSGYRGQQYALARANLPYDHKVQKYAPNLVNVFSASQMVASRANNGQ